jgi:RecB family exonuclease
MPSAYSHSRLSLFEECRLRYRLKYVDRVKRDLEGVEAFLGSRVHEALEALYRDVMMGRTPSCEYVLEDYRRAWDARWSPGVVVASDRYRPADYLAAGEECLRRYHSRHAPFRADRTLAVEARVGVDLPNGARLEGFADRIARDTDGWIAIHDYKTSGTLPTQADVDQDRQLALYQAAVEGMWPGAPGIRLVWHYLRFDERLVSTRSREQIRALLTDTARLVEEVEAETAWEPTVSPLCRWCPYWDLCPEKKHEWALLQKGRGEPSLLPHPAPEAEDAARAVDDAVEAILLRRQAEADLEEARGRILEYARIHGAAAIVAPTGTARVRRGEQRQLPGSSEPGRAELLRAVLDAGLGPDYADVAAARLLEAWQAGALPQALADAVARVARARPFEEVRVTPRKDPGAEPSADAAPGGERDAATS